MLPRECDEGEQNGYITNYKYVHHHLDWFLYGVDVNMSPV